MRKLDCLNVFCELSKYARVAHPDTESESWRTYQADLRAAPGTQPIPQ